MKVQFSSNVDLVRLIAVDDLCGGYSLGGAQVHLEQLASQGGMDQLLQVNKDRMPGNYIACRDLKNNRSLLKICSIYKGLLKIFW